MLDSRKERILQAIIEEYIETAEPVGSKCLHSKYGIEFSTATIRNDMADMEELGYLLKPHTSAGRIPSDKAYRLYVDKILSNAIPSDEILSEDDVMKITKNLHSKVDETSDVLKKIADIVSDVTNYTSFAITPSKGKSVVSALQVIPAQPGMCLVMVVTEQGVTNSAVVNVPFDVTKEYLISFSELLNRKLVGFTLESITPELCQTLVDEFEVATDVLVPVINGVRKCINQIENPKIIYDGTNKIFRQPEFNDIDRTRRFIELMDSNRLLDSKNNSHEDDSEYSISIGSENQSEDMNEFSILSSTYQIGDEILGDIGIVGPTRMDYIKVIACIKYIKDFFERENNSNE